MSTSEPTRSPSLPSTADAVPYVPVSWAAAAAATVAFVFLLTLLGFGYFAFVNKKPLLMPELLVMPAVAVVLSFAARRLIRNSEGTRTGQLYGADLVNAAWWTSLVLGLCYVAYLFAIDYAIRRDAKGEVDKWMVLIKGGSDEELGRAFHRTLAPGQRQSVAPNDLDEMRAKFRDELLVFTNSDLVRLARRNKDAFDFQIGSVTWKYRPGAVECEVAGTITCPEGVFPVALALRGLEGVTGGDAAGAAGAAAGRQWMVLRPPAGGFIEQSRAMRTRYGWLVALLESDGGSFGKEFVENQALTPFGREYSYRAYVLPGGDREGWRDVAVNRLLQLAFAAPTAAVGDAGYASYMATQFFKTGSGGPPGAEHMAQFRAIWNTYGIRPAGERLRDNGGSVPDKENVVTLTDSAVEVRLPVELPLPPKETGGEPKTARGRLVVACTDPEFLALVRKYKQSAEPSNGTTDMPDDLRAELEKRYRHPTDPNRLLLPWRVVRVESDLTPVVIIQQQNQGGRPMPGAGP